MLSLLYVALSFLPLLRAIPMRLSNLRRTRRVHISAKGGYSLIEILTVMSIIGILVTFALPRLGHLRDQSKLQSARTRFTRAVMAARQAAIQRGKRAYFRSSGSKIWVIVDTTGTNADSVLISRQFDLSSNYGVTVTPTSLVTIEYDPRGVSTQASQQAFAFVHTGSGILDSLCVSKLGNTIRDRCP
ncbi:MAG TPA: GspH/FimT family protein [Gemmatimonadaceae bacterium]|nr:GspH/FimT family protein [Gemmatimonadaceae bacterium]